MGSTSRDVAVVIVNWNRREDTLRCLASLERVTSHDLDVFVVDNASTDGSVEAIDATYPDVHLVRSDRNLGFAEGNNLALRMVLASAHPFVLLLNNDAIVDSDTVHLLVEALRLTPEAAAVGPAICYLDEPNSVWSAGGCVDWRRGAVWSPYYNTDLSSLPHSSYNTDHISGCCMLIRTSVLTGVGLLDPRFFMYFEETEWCVRMIRGGHTILVNPAARAWHGIMPDADGRGSPAIAYYMTRNQLLFLWSTKAPVSAWAHTSIRMVRTVLSLYLKPQPPNRVMGRVPMLRALRDFCLGRFGPMEAR